MDENNNLPIDIRNNAPDISQDAQDKADQQDIEILTGENLPFDLNKHGRPDKFENSYRQMLKNRILELRMDGVPLNKISERLKLSPKWVKRLSDEATESLFKNSLAKRDEIIVNQIKSLDSMFDTLLTEYAKEDTKLGLKIAIYDRALETKKYIGKLAGVNIDRVESKNFNIQATDRLLDAMGIPKKTPKDIRDAANDTEGDVLMFQPYNYDETTQIIQSTNRTVDITKLDIKEGDIFELPNKSNDNIDNQDPNV